MNENKKWEEHFQPNMDTFSGTQQLFFFFYFPKQLISSSSNL